MKSVKLVGFVLVAASLLIPTMAWGQGGNPPASTKESRQTSGGGQTAVEQTYKGSSGTIREQIKTLQEQVIQASLQGDTTVLEKYFAADYTATHGDGRVVTRAQEIENLKSGATKYESLVVRESKIRTYGDTAIVDSLTSVKGTVDGKPFSGDVRTTRIWVKHKGDWKTVALQVTRVAPASQ